MDHAPLNSALSPGKEPLVFIGDCINIISFACMYYSLKVIFIIVSYISLYDMFRPYTAIIVYISILPELFHIGFFLMNAILLFKYYFIYLIEWTFV
jgi:hypothetical protein